MRLSDGWLFGCRLGGGGGGGGTVRVGDRAPGSFDFLRNWVAVLFFFFLGPDDDGARGFWAADGLTFWRFGAASGRALFFLRESEVMTGTLDGDGGRVPAIASVVSVAEIPRHRQYDMTGYCCRTLKDYLCVRVGLLLQRAFFANCVIGCGWNLGMPAPPPALGPSFVIN